MTPEQEQEMHKKRDAVWMTAAREVLDNAYPPEEFIEEYDRIQPLYDGTSYQKMNYPKRYEEYLKTLSENEKSN